MISFAEFFHLQQFTLNHLLRQFNQGVENAKVPLLHRHFESLHVEPVARQHAFRVAPLGIGGGPAAPCLGFVDDVVVHQRGGMNNLDHGAQSYGAASSVIEQFGGKKKQSGTDALAASRAQILTNLGDGLHA